MFYRTIKIISFLTFCLLTIYGAYYFSDSKSSQLNMRINQIENLMQSSIDKVNSVLSLGGDTRNAVGGERYFLSGSGISASQTTISLTKFGYTRPNGSYNTFTITNFGDLGCGTVQPGNTSGKQEFVSFTGVTQNSDGTAQLTGVTRGLDRVPPYTASSTLQTAHAGASEFVISNSPPCFYEGYANKNNTETITQLWNFDDIPWWNGTTAASSSNQLATRGYADSLTITGAPTSTFSGMGVVKLATLGSQLGTGIGTSTEGRPLVVSSLFGTSSPYSLSVFRQGGLFPTGSTTDGLGQISRWFLPTTTTAGEVRWDNAHYFNGSLSSGGGLTVNDSAIFAGGFRISTTSVASSSPLTVDSNGNLRLMPPNVDMGTAFIANGSTGNQVVNHTLGRLPSFIEITASGNYADNSPANTCAIVHSTGAATSTVGTSQYSMWNSIATFSSDTNAQSYPRASTSPNRIIYSEVTDSNTTVLAMEAQLTVLSSTSFTLNWITNDGGSGSGCSTPGGQRAFFWKVY